jgi:hypothetical protein
MGNERRASEHHRLAVVQDLVDRMALPSASSPARRTFSAIAITCAPVAASRGRPFLVIAVRVAAEQS